MWRTVQVGLTEGETETQSSLWTAAVAAVGETPSLTRECLEKWSRAEQVNCIVPSLVPIPQAAPQRNKDGSPAQVNT